MSLLELAGRLDVALFQQVNGWCGNWVLDRIAGYEEHDYLFKGGILLAAYWWFWFTPDESRRPGNRRLIVEALLGAMLALLINRALATGLPFRLRPMYTPGIGYHAPSFDLQYNMESWSSFPSDAATYWLALSFGLLRVSRPVGALSMVFSLVWMCLPRVYLGIHYPADILVGAPIGPLGVWLTAWGFAVRRDRLGSAVMDGLRAFERSAPHWFYAAAFLFSFELARIFDDVRDMVRGVVRGLAAGGHIMIGEGAALFLIGGVVLLICLVAALAMHLRRRFRL
jgi:membrane-associated phospholipid phosphatase